jgi:hypothetical protein
MVLARHEIEILLMHHSFNENSRCLGVGAQLELSLPTVATLQDFRAGTKKSLYFLD